MKDKHYGALDGLRVIAAVGIIMMHMLVNNNYDLKNAIITQDINMLTNLVFLFMMISAFGLCCGYYNKVRNNQFSLHNFYSKRYKKILPFFTLLVCIDLILTHSIGALIEGFADLTLVFGFLPECGNIKVIGVGWFLGVVFIFYMIFPFYCYLIENKTKAWVVLIISLIFNYVAEFYFGVERENILFCSPYFIMGGILFLYKDTIAQFANKFRHILLIGCLLLSIVYFGFGANTIIILLTCIMYISYALGVLWSSFFVTLPPNFLRLRL